MVLCLGCPPPRVERSRQEIPRLEDPLEGASVSFDPLSRQQVERGWSALLEGAVSEAKTEFDKALRNERSVGHTDTVYPILTALGYCAMLQGDGRQAESFYQRALSLEPSFSPALSGLGVLYQRQGESERAYRMYSKALEVNPKSSVARLGLDVTRLTLTDTGLAAARRLAADGRYDEAIDRYEQIVEVAPELSEAYFEWADLLEKTGRLDEAVDVLKRGVERQPANVDALVRLGALLERVDDPRGAVDAYVAAIRIDPSNEQAKQGYQRALVSERARNLPPEIQNLKNAPVVRRDQIATLLAYKLPLHQHEPSRTGSAVIITDIRSSWAKPYIQEVVATGLMDVYENHTFRPTRVVTRMDMAAIAGRVLSEFEANGMIPETRRRSIQIRDIPKEHLMYDVICQVLARGIMALSPEGDFNPSLPISGEEAVRVIERLVLLVK